MTPCWPGNRPGRSSTSSPKAILDRPNIYITEDGDHINIELPNLSITIKTKK